MRYQRKYNKIEILSLMFVAAGLVWGAGCVKVIQVATDVAIIHARLNLTGQVDQAGRTLDPSVTVMVFVAAKGADGWIVQAAQNTDVVPGMETHAAKWGHLESADYRRDRQRRS